MKPAGNTTESEQSARSSCVLGVLMVVLSVKAQTHMCGCCCCWLSFTANIEGVVAVARERESEGDRRESERRECVHTTLHAFEPPLAPTHTNPLAAMCIHVYNAQALTFHTM